MRRLSLVIMLHLIKIMCIHALSAVVALMFVRQEDFWLKELRLQNIMIKREEIGGKE
jgi:hypothetical protein